MAVDAFKPVGTYRLKGQQCQDIVLKALELGYRHIDTAAVYKNEEQVGQAVSKAIEKGIITREDVFITSKIAPKHQGYEKALAAIQDSVKAIGYPIDLMLIHWPGSQGLKPDHPKNLTNRQETLQALVTAKAKGWVKAIGVSNYNLKHLTKDVLEHAQVNQIEFHPLLWTLETRALMDKCREHQMVVEAYSSLGEGKLVNGEIDCPILDQLAQSLQVTKAQLLLSWGIKKGCIVLPKASSVERLEENLLAAKVKLDPITESQIDALVDQLGPRKFCWNPDQIL